VRYAALLRGINVGGKSLIPMSELRECVAAVVHAEVSTYIASGNVIFEAPRRGAAALEAELEHAIEQRFRLDVKVFVRTAVQLEAVAAAVPPAWIGNARLRCNGIFLAREIDRPSLVDELAPKDGIEEVIHVKGTLLWAAQVASLAKSSMVKLSRRPVYKQMTVRNLNTTLKLHELVSGS
jgi:uncharacterized protein (DUF1697 family)